MELFVNVLGYVMNPDAGYNLTTELKNIKDAKKTDGAILQQGGSALAVIELKGADTKDLGKVNEQAFNYKNNQLDCVYVITSNFEKLRFFIHNAVEHEEFNLFALTKERFALLWLFLQKDNLLSGIPAKIKEESLLQEEKITKALYADYSAFKNDLWNDMVQQNPQHDPLLLYKKSQKLLDRFLFIFFSEDKGLLPPNSISAIIDQWADLKDRDAYSPLYSRFKKYFGYMNAGFKGKFFEIHAYNGGLFIEDELLDSLLINDELLKNHSLKLTNYDFADEVDTNILGHIFEHSLNDIENVRAKLAGEEIDKSKTKRKKDGVFYTPKYITKYIVDNTVGKLCEEKKSEIGIDEEEFAKERKGRRKDTIKKLDAQLKQYREWLLQLTICDPACGSGAFLNQALEFLMGEHRYVDELNTQLFEGSIVFQDVENHILENNIYGVDINEESVEIARLSLWLRTAQKGRKLTSLSSNIKCGNSLIDDPKVAGDLAFNWKEQFPQVFNSSTRGTKQSGFDVLIGNPPYVKVQLLKHEEIDWYKANMEVAFKRVDISLMFFELGKKLLRRRGALSFITSNQFLISEYGRKCRQLLLRDYQITKLIDFGDLPIFEGALTYVSIFCLRLDDAVDFKYCNVDRIEDAVSGSYKTSFSVIHSNLTDEIWVLKDSKEEKLIHKLQKLDNLSSIGTCNYGVITGNDTIFNLTTKQVRELEIEKDATLPLIRANNCSRYIEVGYEMRVIYPYKNIEGKTVLLEETEFKRAHPIAYSYLLSKKEELSQRKDSRKTFFDREDWYTLTRFGRIDMFSKQKIVFPGETKEHKFGLDSNGAGYSGARVFSITLEDTSEGKIELECLLGVLNSSLIQFFLHSTSPVKQGGYFSYSSTVVNKVPIAIGLKSQLTPKVQLIISINMRLNKLVSNLIELIQSKFDIEKPSTKLQHWPRLDFKGFLAELKKAKVPQLSLDQEAEWMEYFHKKKAEANAIQAEIDRIDKEIDQLVYQLYELTAEEIAIVEQG